MADGYTEAWTVVPQNTYPATRQRSVIVKDSNGNDIQTGTVYCLVDGECRAMSAIQQQLYSYMSSLDVRIKDNEELDQKDIRVVYSDGINIRYSQALSFQEDFPTSPQEPDKSLLLYLFNGTPVNFSITFKITEVKWATLMLPFACNIPTHTNENPTSETAEIMALKSFGSRKGSDGNIYLILKKQGTRFEANTPYILYGTPGTYTVTGTITGATPITKSEGLITGNNAPIVLKQNDHAMQNHKDSENKNHVGYYNVPTDGTVTLPPYRAFMTKPQATEALEHPVIGMSPTQSAPGLFFMIEDDDPTFINKINNDDATIPMFDLSGRPVNVPVKGNVYIKNGKKILK